MTENDVLHRMQKRTYNGQLDRLGFFCQVCDGEVDTEAKLVHFESTESAQSLNVCHDCLPKWFE